MLAVPVNEEERMKGPKGENVPSCLVCLKPYWAVDAPHAANCKTFNLGNNSELRRGAKRFEEIIVLKLVTWKPNGACQGIPPTVRPHCQITTRTQ